MTDPNDGLDPLGDPWTQGDRHGKNCRCPRCGHDEREEVRLMVQRSA